MVKPYVRGLKFLTFGGCKSLRSGVVNPYVRGFINPWVIDHSRYISETIYIRGVLLFFVLFLYKSLCPATDKDPHNLTYRSFTKILAGLNLYSLRHFCPSTKQKEV